mmetsp:Transcript_72540/g.117659  ORF Transcript_72540/g.117659 Transcript_72540/m.117659 type:complete len:122 (+) Transcript_72540:772-1137(+)
MSMTNCQNLSKGPPFVTLLLLFRLWKIAYPSLLQVCQKQSQKLYTPSCVTSFSCLFLVSFDDRSKNDIAYACIYVHLHIERETERKGKGGGERERERERESVSAFVRERGPERERERVHKG